MTSDHSPISINIGIPFIFYQFFSHKYNLNRVDCRVFRSELLAIHEENELPLLSNSLSILNAYQKFVKDIDDALHKADARLDMKPSRKKLYPSSPPWWSQECDRLVRIRLAKLKHNLAKSYYESFIDYQKFSAQTTKRLKIIKRSSFKSFCESLSFNSPLANVWSKIQGFRHRLLKVVLSVRR